VTTAALAALREEANRPVVVRTQTGNLVELMVRGMPLLAYEESDGIGRDVAIAALLRLKFKTDAVGALCGVSHGWVCKVRARLREGGVGEVVRVRPDGRPPTLVGAMYKRFEKLHAEGKTPPAIARELGIGSAIVYRAVKVLEESRASQVTLGASAASEPASPAGALAGLEPVRAPSEPREGVSDAEPPVEELAPGAALPSGPTEHPTRYAGVLLVAGALAAIGIREALSASRVARPKAAVYDATTAILSMMAGWSVGFASLEAMHERDARALGVVLGLERSPSVRTLHRAIAQMRVTFDPSAFSAAWIRAVLAARLPDRLCFGLDGHFKAYAGDEPIDKGWDSKRRLVTKGLADVVITDERGWTWGSSHVGAADALSHHVLTEAMRLRAVLGEARPIVLAFDRGGFSFEALEALDAEGFGYVTYVPATVTLPALGGIAPATDGIAESAFVHAKLHHHARLLVERDGEALVPIATNVTTLVEAAEIVRVLRSCRGAQENAFKAAREHAHIDRLVDRGVTSRAPDDRPINNPARTRLKMEVAELRTREVELAKERPSTAGRTQKQINDDRFRVGAYRKLAEIELDKAPVKVPRVSVQPAALKATLDTDNRALLQPMKLATENARRWLLATLHDGLAPSDAEYDAEATARTLSALLRAPGTVRFDDDLVHVTLDLPLPPAAHARLDAALGAIDDAQFRFTDGRRRLAVRLAPRPTRGTLPHTTSTAN
jgi:hypothetical protein